MALLAAALLAVAGCRPERVASRPATDDGWTARLDERDLPDPQPTGAPRPGVIPDAERELWLEAGRWGELARSGRPAVSTHAHGTYQAQLWFNSEAASSATSGSTLGALIAQELTDPTGQLASVWYTMALGNDGWSFAILDAKRRVVSRPAHTKLCARCHAEAPSGSVFGPLTELAGQ